MMGNPVSHFYKPEQVWVEKGRKLLNENCSCYLWFLVCSSPTASPSFLPPLHFFSAFYPPFCSPSALSLSRSIGQRNIEDIFYRQAYPGASLHRLDQVINPLSFPVVIVRSTNLKSTFDFRSSLISHIHCLSETLSLHPDLLSSVTLSPYFLYYNI